MQALLIPDLYEPASTWRAVVAQLEKANIYTTVMEYKPPRDEDISEIVETAASHLIDETVVVGYGIGGRIAVQLAAQQPHQLAGIILISTPAMKAPGIQSFIKKLLLFILAPFRIIIPYYLRHKVELLYKRYYPGDPQKLLYRSIVAEEQDAFLAKITDPLLLLWGENDERVRPAVTEVMHETLDYADVKHDIQLVADTGSALHKTHPDVVAQSVLQLLKP